SHVEQGEEPLGELVDLALARLVGGHGDAGIMPAFHRHGHRQLPARPRKAPLPWTFFGRAEPGAEELRCLGNGRVGSEMGAVKVLHEPGVGGGREDRWRKYAAGRAMGKGATRPLPHPVSYCSW